MSKVTTVKCGGLKMRRSTGALKRIKEGFKAKIGKSSNLGRTKRERIFKNKKSIGLSEPSCSICLKVEQW